MKKVFLGGTCAGSRWRNRLIPMLGSRVDYFNPVVENWTPECFQEELHQRQICDYCLYVVTPNIEGFLSFVEVADDSNKRPEKTLFCVLEIDPKDGQLTEFTPKQMKSFDAISKILEMNGSKTFNSLESVAEYLNSVA